MPKPTTPTETLRLDPRSAPTYAEAIVHPAGRVLDALVAERVFGSPVKWTDDPYPGRNIPHAAGMQPYYYGVHEGVEFTAASVARYSTDDAAAVSIIRHMAALGWRWCVHDTASYEADAEMAAQEPFYCYFQKRTPDGGVEEPEAAGETFALSVARAALGATCTDGWTNPADADGHVVRARVTVREAWPKEKTNG